MNIDLLLGCGLQLLQSSSNSFRSKEAQQAPNLFGTLHLKKKEKICLCKRVNPRQTIRDLSPLEWFSPSK